MIELAVASLVIGLVASLLGFTTIAGASFAIAKIIAAVFLVLFSGAAARRVGRRAGVVLDLSSRELSIDLASQAAK